MSAPQQPPPVLPDGWPPFATYDEVSELLNVAKSSLYYWVKCGMCPSPVRFGGSSRFDRNQVQTMLEGAKPRGTFTVTFSTKRRGGKKGGKKAASNRRKRDAKLESQDSQEGQ